MDFPGGPISQTLCFQCKGPQVRSLVGELGSYMPRSVALLLPKSLKKPVGIVEGCIMDAEKAELKPTKTQFRKRPRPYEADEYTFLNELHVEI